MVDLATVRTRYERVRADRTSFALLVGSVLVMAASVGYGAGSVAAGAPAGDVLPLSLPVVAGIASLLLLYEEAGED